MNIKECENCGSHQFHKVDKQWICDYCQTTYINEKTEEYIVKLSDKYGKIQRISLVLPIVLILIFLAFFYFINKKNEQTNAIQTSAQSQTREAPDESTSDVKKAMSDWQKTLKQAGITDNSSRSSDISTLGSWTQSIYDSLTVGTENYDAQSEKYNYTNGANFDELIKKVGQPDSISADRNTSYGMPVRVRTSWSQDKNGKNAGVTVTVTYIEANKMIIDKQLEHY